MTKYCRYHHNHGHTTEECKALQDKIEELVRVGHFRRFIRRDDHSSSRSRHPPRHDHRHQPSNAHHNSHSTQITNQQPEPAHTNITPADPPLRGTINTISGGFASGGSTSSARKKHLRHIQSINHITHSHHRRLMPPSYSQMTTSTASTTNRMTPWSSPSKSKTMPLRKYLWIKAAQLTSSTGPPTKSYNFLIPP